MSKRGSDDLSTTTDQRDQTITTLINGTVTSVKNVVPLEFKTDNARLLDQSVKLEYGVLIGIIGDVEGKLILEGEPAVFSSLGDSLYGMPMEEEMLVSFTGELGNMIAGGLSSIIIEYGIKTDITSPTVMQGNTTVTGFKRAIHIPASFENIGDIGVYLLLD
ncbi:chemotaxis protein CheX [Sutcliffiella cohnii]